jgi:anti-anti-sigma factor
MTVDLDAHVARPALAFNFELSHGRPGAAARVELHDRAVGEAGGSNGISRRARLALRGCIDVAAARRLEHVLDDLASRGVDQVLVDCAELRHIDFRVVPALMATLDRFEAHSSGVVLCGLSRYLRDLFRMAGCESRLRCWSSAADLLATGAPAPEPARECAS